MRPLSKKAFYIILPLLLFICGGIFWGIKESKEVLKKQILAQTSDGGSIGKVHFDFYEFRFSIEDIEINKLGSFKKVYLDIAPWSLIDKKVRITNLELEEFNFKINRKGKELSIPGLKTPETSGPKIRDENEKKNSDPSIISLQIDNIEIKSTAIDIEGDEFKLRSLKVKNFVYFFKEMKQRQYQKLFVNIDFSFNQCESTLKVELPEFNPSNFKKAIGSLEIPKCHLKDFDNIKSAFAPKVQKIEGAFNLKTNFTYTDNIALEMPELNLKDLKIHSLTKKDTLDYFIKSLKVIDLKLQKTPRKFELTINETIFNNLITPLPLKSLSNKFSKFSDIKLTDLKLLSTDSGALSFETEYNKNGKIIVSKNENPNTKDGDLEVIMKAIDLVPFGETFEQNLGYQVNNGKINGKIRTVTKDNKVKGKAFITLAQFQLDNENETGKKLERKSGIPLQTAVSLAKNDEGVIDIEIDISGKTNDPNFGFLPMVKSGIGQFFLDKLINVLATKLSENMLPMLFSSIPLSPLNTLFVVKNGIAMINKPRFEDLEFLPEKTELRSKSKEALKKFAEFLKENNKFKFQLCPMAVSKEGDEDFDEEDALDLAKSRIKKIKKEFAKSKVDSSNFSFCRPKFEKNRQKYGTMEINL